MRIGFDAKRAFHNNSGLGNYSRDLIRILAACYPENDYLLYNPKKGKLNFSLPEHTTEKLPSGFFNRKLSSLWRRQGIVKDLVRDNIDLFHGLSNELPVGLPKNGIRSIVTIHDLIFIKFPEWYKPADRIIHQKKVQQAAKDADKIIAISQQTKKDIMNYLAVDEKKIEIVYQGCHKSFKKKYTSAQLQEVKVKYGLPDKFVLSVGTIEERKNLLTTVKSLPYHNLPLVAIGRKTAYFDRVQETITDLDLGKRVIFPENVSIDELAMIYQQAFVFCYPSLYEGFGIPIIEALFSGVPVITNEEGVFREAAGEAGLYIKHDDALAMSEKIRLLENEELRSKYVASGLAHAQKFTEENIALNIMNIYKKVLSIKP